MKIGSYVAPYGNTVVGEAFMRNNEKSFSGKLLERANNGEKVNLFQELKDGVIVEISDDALAEFNEKAKEIKNGNLEDNELTYEEKVKLLQESLKPAQRLHRIIPNIKTNDMLERSLKGADQSIVDATYDIIGDSLLPHNVGNLTEEERRELIYIGLEEAKYLAQGLDADKAELFMEAMNTIAKYGLNGMMDEQGNVIYDIRQGAMVGAPDDYISSGELMKKIAPNQYEKYQEMMKEGRVLEAARFMIDWEINAYRYNSGAVKAVKEEQVRWKESVDNTVIESSYHGTDMSGLQAFIDSILKQNQTLNQDDLMNHLQQFTQAVTSDDR